MSTIYYTIIYVSLFIITKYSLVYVLMHIFSNVIASPAAIGKT